MGIPRRIRPISLLVATALAACQSTTAPDLGLEFDTEGTISAYQSMDSALASPTLASFQLLQGRTPFGGSPAGAALGVLSRESVSDGGRAFALDLAGRVARLSASSGPAAAPIISDTHRGATFVFDFEADRYVRDDSRMDAPETGVRFVLYETDFLGTPVSEDEIGFADLIDEGDDSAEDIALHLVVVAYETTVLEYDITLDVLPGGGTLSVSGALQEPNGPRLDFAIDATGTELGEGATRLDVAFELGVDTHDFSIVGTVTGIEDDVEGDGEIELIVRHGSHSIRVSVEGADGQIDGSVFVNGTLFATVMGDASDPVIASATGDPLTVRELLALRHIIDGVEDVFDFLEDLLDPVDELIILAIIL